MKWFWIILYMISLLGSYWWIVDPTHDRWGVRLFIGVGITLFVVGRIIEELNK